MGFAFFLKAMFPNVDWSNPQKAIESMVPGLDINTAAAEFFSALALVQQTAATQGRIEAKLDLLLAAGGIEYVSPALQLVAAQEA